MFRWDEVKHFTDSHDVYTKLLGIFVFLYNDSFTIMKIRIKNEELFTPWITKGIKKSSKRFKIFFKKPTILYPIIN